MTDRAEQGGRAMGEQEPIFLVLADLAKAKGVTPIADKLWEVKLDDHWWFVVNGFPVEKKVIGGGSGVEYTVKPFHCYVEFNGWPAGIFNPYQGEFAAGDVANEDSFRAAIEKYKQEQVA